MTDQEIRDRIDKLKQLFEEDPYLGKTFSSARELQRAQAASVYGRISAVAEMAHLAQLLKHRTAAEVMVHPPTDEDREMVIGALRALDAEFSETETFVTLLAFLTDALGAPGAALNSK